MLRAVAQATRLLCVLASLLLVSLLEWTPTVGVQALDGSNPFGRQGGGGGNFFFSNGGRGGGWPGGGGTAAADNDEYYKVLGVPKDANERTIKRAYRRLAVQKHPDKGGDPEDFKKLSEAYEVLSDPSKRRVYDSHGKAGLNGAQGGMGEGGMPPEAAEDLFSHLFGQAGMGGMGMGGARARRGPRKARDVAYQLRVSLRDLYTGKTTQVQLVIEKVENGYIKREPKDVEIHVERGMAAGDRVVLHGEADSGVEGIAPGDLVFVLQEAEDPTFSRVGDHLVCEVEVSLVEALRGFSKAIRTVDGKLKKVTMERGADVISPGCYRKVQGWGMPVRGSSDEFGDLYIKFSVSFPSVEELNRATASKASEIELLESDVDALEAMQSSSGRRKGAAAKGGSSSSSSSSNSSRSNSGTGRKDGKPAGTKAPGRKSSSNLQAPNPAVLRAIRSPQSAEREEMPSFFSFFR